MNKINLFNYANKYTPYFYKIASKELKRLRCNNIYDLSQDVVQESLMILWIKLDNWKGDEKYIVYYVSLIIKNVCNIFYSKIKNEINVDSIEMFENTIKRQNIIDFNKNMIDFENNYDAAIKIINTGSLTRREQEVIMMKFNGNTTLEIATKLKLCERTVLNYYYKAIKKISLTK